MGHLGKGETLMLPGPVVDRSCRRTEEEEEEEREEVLHT